MSQQQQPLASSSIRPSGYGSMAASSSSNVPDVDFNQPNPVEFNELCNNIASNIQVIITSWKQLEEAFRSIGTDNDSTGLRDKIHVGQMSTNQIIAQTTKDMQKLSNFGRRGNKAQRVQVERLTNKFKKTVENYGQIQQKVASKLRATALIRPRSQMEEEEKSEMEEEERIQRMSQQRQLQKDLQFENELLFERERRMKQIEGDIIDVNQIMRELAAMTHEQGASITSIEDNIETAHYNVDEGRQQLIQAEIYQSKRRRKICFLLIIATVVAAIIITVIVIKFTGKKS